MQHNQFFSVIFASRKQTEKRFGKDVELESKKLY